MNTCPTPDPRLAPSNLALLRLAVDRLRQIVGELDAIVALAAEEPEALPDGYADKVRSYCTRIANGGSGILRILDVLEKAPASTPRQVRGGFRVASIVDALPPALRSLVFDDIPPGRAA